MSEIKPKKMVGRSVAVALGIICIILAACLGGVVATYTLMINDKSNAISSLNHQISQLNSSVANLQSQVASDNSTIDSLTSQVTNLQNQLRALEPSLVYDFNSTILFNGEESHYYGGSFLGWNTTGYVFTNETYAVSIHLGGSLSRQLEAVNSNVRVSFDWLFEATMVVSRQLDGVYYDLVYSYSFEGLQPNTNTINFDVDNGTKFTVRFVSSGGLSTYLYRVELWNAVESS